MVGLSSHLIVQPNGGQEIASTSIIKSAEMVVILPDGQEQDFEMKDDGMNGDLVAGDGEYTAKLPVDETGIYYVEAFIKGVMGDGTQFVRYKFFFFFSL